MTACAGDEGSTSSLNYDDGMPAGYPYATWQQDEPNCVPRAFECQTGVYDENLMGGPNDETGKPVEWIDSGGKTFYGRGEGQLPASGDVVYYDYEEGNSTYEGHAGVCVGYSASGQCIIATGHQQNPYDVRDSSDLTQSYTPAYPNR